MDERKENDQEMKGKGSVDTLRAVGIIAEYNPFHNGHKYHLQQSMEKTGADVSVAVISGNFTQRGSWLFWISGQGQRWLSETG